MFLHREKYFSRRNSTQIVVPPIVTDALYACPSSFAATRNNVRNAIRASALMTLYEN